MGWDSLLRSRSAFRRDDGRNWGDYGTIAARMPLLLQKRIYLLDVFPRDVARRLLE